MNFIRPWDTDGVCSRVILKDFKEKQANTEGQLWDCGEQLPYDVFVKQLRKMCVEWDHHECEGRMRSWSHWDGAYIPKMALIEAYTAHSQPLAESYFERLGFQQIGPFEKLKHPETKLSVWIISAPAFCEAIGYTSKYDPRTKDSRCAA